MRCVPAGKRDLSDEVYPAVKDAYPQLCDEDIMCSDICSNGNASPEWKHRVRTVLHRLKDDSESRVSGLDAYGMRLFE